MPLHSCPAAHTNTHTLLSIYSVSPSSLPSGGCSPSSPFPLERRLPLVVDAAADTKDMSSLMPTVLLVLFADTSFLADTMLCKSFNLCLNC